MPFLGLSPARPLRHMPKTLLRPTQRIKRVAGEQELIIRQLDEAQAGRGQVLLPIASIAESPEARNSRRGYDEAKLNELAASIQTHGVLQPILVSPDGEGYQVIARNRRLKAALRAGLEGVPAIVKSHLDDETKYLINLVENIQRVDLSPRERVEAIRQLASSGLGVREISRGTGLAPSTISRWIRVAGNHPGASRDGGRPSRYLSRHAAGTDRRSRARRGVDRHGAWHGAQTTSSHFSKVLLVTLHTPSTMAAWPMLIGSWRWCGR